VAEGGGLLILCNGYQAIPDYTRNPRFIGPFAQCLGVAVPANPPLSQIVGCQFGRQFLVGHTSGEADMWKARNQGSGS
jgi:hypothetical protein